MEYQELRPPAALRAFIKCLWTLRGVSHDPAPQRILPDGSVELILHFSGDYRRHEPDGRVVVQPRALVVGVVDRWVMLESAGSLDMLGVRFRPGAVRGVLGLAQPRLSGDYHDLEDLGIPTLQGLMAEARAEGDLTQRVALVWARLIQAANDTSPPHPTVLLTARRIVASAGNVPIRGIAKDAGWSLRHLERRFRGRGRGHCKGVCPPEPVSGGGGQAQSGHAAPLVAAGGPGRLSRSAPSGPRFPRVRWHHPGRLLAGDSPPL